jgi:predicted permease
MGTLFQDLRYGLRMLVKNPGFACMAIIMLALGICANVAIFGFVDATLIKPLPYRDPSRLVGVFESVATSSRDAVSYLDYLDWKNLNKVFGSIDAYALNGGFTLSTTGGAQQVTGTRVSDGFFRTLGVTPALGRDFHSGENLPAVPDTVMLSYAAWQRRFGGRQDVVGQAVTLNGDPTIIIGVLPRDFHFAPAGGAEFWGMLHASDYCEQHRACHNLNTVARIKDGVSVRASLADIRALAQQLEKQYPESNRGQSANVVPLSEVIVGDVRPILFVLLSGAGLLLLIACVNITSLLLARSESRKREIAVRGALGASSARLFRQFATEGLVLTAVGTLLGLI